MTNFYRPRLAIGCAVLGLVLVAAGVGRNAFHAEQAGGSLARLVVGNFAVETARAEKAPQMDEVTAVAKARLIVDERLPETDVRDRARKLTGEIVTGDSLRLIDLAFAPAATAVSSDRHAFEYTTPNPRDVWIVIFEETGLRMDDWGIEDGALFVAIVFDEATGSPISVTFEHYNPALPGPRQRR